MKNLVLILSAVIALSLLCGCEKDNPPPPPPDPTSTPDAIVGYWNMTKIVKDGVDLTDDCTTQSFMSILEANTFSGDDYDLVQGSCSFGLFTGSWVHLDSTDYTFSIFGNEFIMVLNEDSLRTKFIHANDGLHYIEEYVRQE